MSHSGLGNIRVTKQMGVQHSVIDRLMQRSQATEIVGERPRYGWPHKTTSREERLIAGCVRRNVFPTSARFRD